MLILLVVVGIVLLAVSRATIHFSSLSSLPSPETEDGTFLSLRRFSRSSARLPSFYIWTTYTLPPVLLSHHGRLSRRRDGPVWFTDAFLHFLRSFVLHLTL